MDEKRILDDMNKFVEEIEACETTEQAIELNARINEYIKANKVPDDLNIVKNSGYGEMLGMLAAL